MVVATLYVWGQRILAGVTAWAVAAVVAESDRLGEGDVEPQCARDGDRHLRHLERVGEAGALVVFWEDEHLRLAGQAPKRRSMQDAVAVALKAGAKGVGLFLRGSIACTK